MPRVSVEAERKQEILGAACTMVSEVGFKSLRVSDVAKLAGISTGSVHYYFDTKRDLMHAAFEWNFERSIERRRDLLEGSEAPAKRLRSFIESYLPADPTTVSAWRVWAELWVEALHDPDLQELNERVYGEWRRTVAAIIRDGQDRGDFRAGGPVLMANGLVGMIDGLSLQVLMRSKSMTVERMREVSELFVSLVTDPQ
jgi:AcrR family transcriptional regulator